MHLLAQAGIGERLDHVHQPAARAGKPVLALTAAVEAAHNRDFGHAQAEQASAVVQHQLDLRARSRLAPGRTGEDHVLHRGAADGGRRLLAESPQNGIRDVRFSGAVWADDHADSRPELEACSIRKGLESL